MSEAGDSIHSLSSCTHIGALKTECKYKISLKSAYLYNPTVQGGTSSQTQTHGATESFHALHYTCYVVISPWHTTTRTKRFSSIQYLGRLLSQKIIVAPECGSALRSK